MTLISITLATLLSTCSIDTRGNPMIVTCPKGCVVKIFNGNPGPRPEVSPGCSALRR